MYPPPHRGYWTQKTKPTKTSRRIQKDLSPSESPQLERENTSKGIFAGGDQGHQIHTVEWNLRVWSRENNLPLQKISLEMTADKQALRSRRTLIPSLLPKYAALVLAVSAAQGQQPGSTWQCIIWVLTGIMLSQDSALATTNSHERSCSSCLDASAPPGQC